MSAAFGEFETPLGRMAAAVDEAGRLLEVAFVSGACGPTLARPERLPRSDAAVVHIAQQLEEYFAGRRSRFDLAIGDIGSDFQRAVWAELRRIPLGEVRTYGELAMRLGRPGAARAVGRANATNPIAVIVPCHRVIGSDGALTGYAGGLELKRALLELERRLAPRVKTAPE